ncbi:MAG: ABC transporter permease [Acidimicrobiia bacterium]|nr:ABC transporter permease [Acidimicrobiia bacterium]
MKAAIIIAAKDLRQRVRDRSAIIMGIVAPFALAAIFSLLLPSSQGFHTEYAVVDLDHGPVSALFTEQILPGVVDSGFADVRTVDDREAAAVLVEGGEVDAAFVIPAGFSQSITSGRDATISIIGNVDAGFSTQIAEAIASSFAEEVNAVSLSVAAALGGFTVIQPEALADLSARAAVFEPAILVEDSEADSKQMTDKTFYSASMAIMFLFFTAQFGILSLLAERRQGTLPRLVAAPVGPWTIVIGKALTGFVLGVVAMTVLIAASTLLLGADWGNPIGVVLLALAAVVSATGVSAMAATMARTEEQASGWNAIVAMTLAILGGTFFSLDRAPEFVGRLSLLTPHAWFLRGLDELASPAGGVADVLPATGVMVAIGVVTGGIGLLRARKLVVGQ